MRTSPIRYIVRAPSALESIKDKSAHDEVAVRSRETALAKFISDWILQARRPDRESSILLLELPFG